MIKIGHFIDFINYARGGAETNVEGLCRNFQYTDCKLEIVTSCSLFQMKAFKNQPITVRTSVGFYKIREMSFLFNGRFSDFLYNFHKLVYARTVTKHFSSYDIIHSHSMDVAGSLLHEQMNRPVVLTIYNPPKLSQYKILVRMNAVIIRSRILFENLVNALPEIRYKLYYIPPGCEFSYFAPREQSSNFLSEGRNLSSSVKLLFIGRFRPFKNIEVLFHALAILNANSTLTYNLTIVGSGPREKELKALINYLGISSYVSFAGTFSSSDLYDIYQSHDIVIVPSFYESFSQVALEALVARRRLLISSGLGEFRSFFPEVPIFDPASSEDLSKKIKLLIETGIPRTENTRFDIFRWDNISQEHYTIYRKLMDDLPRSSHRINSIEKTTN